MTLIQAILIGCVAALTQFEGGWLGECKLREPIVTGFLVGLILGDMKTGLIIGASLQLIWMGATGIGPTAQLDIGTGGTIGAAIAIATGTGVETAIAFGVPIAIIMQFIHTMLLTTYSGLMIVVDKKIDEGKFGYIFGIHAFCGIMDFLMYSLLTFMALYFGNDVINAMVSGLPEWANSGLAAVAAILPAMGFALLLNIILEKDLVPFFIIGFVLAAYSGIGYTMVGIAALAGAIAWIIFILKRNNVSSPVQQVVENNEWEDD